VARLAETGTAGVPPLVSLRRDDIPDWLCGLAQGESPTGERTLVAFSPTSGVAALLGGIVGGVGLAGESSGRIRVLALAPAWREVDRRALALAGGLPFELTALAVPALADDGVVEAEPQSGALGASPELAGASLAAPAERARFERALAGLRGLAAKHGGVVRGGEGVAELVLFARPVAALRAGHEGAVLDVIEPARASYRLAGEDLADALDRLEGQLRKYLSDRKVREGDDGVRARAWEPLAQAAGGRSVRAWPAGDECEAADFAGVDPAGTPLIGAARRRVDLGVLAAVVEAALRLETIFPALLAQAAPPVRLGAPTLALAGAEFTAAVDIALRHLTLGARTWTLRETPAGVDLALREPGAAPAPRAAFARPEPRPEPRPEAPRERRYEPAPIAPPPPAETLRAPDAIDERDDEDDDDDAGAVEAANGDAPIGDGDGDGSGRRRRRRRGRRGRRSEGEGGGAPRERQPERAPDRPAERAAVEERTDAAAPRPFLEMSLFDLEDEPPSEGGDDSRGRRRRRGRRRGGRRSEGGEAPGDDDEEPGRDEAPLARAATESPDDEDADALLELSPDAPELEEPEPQYEEGDLEEAPLSATERLRLERERRRRAQVADAPLLAPSEPGEAVGTGEAEPELPRGRAAILAHADRRSILGALLLAREVRAIEGIWIYPQSELMTFFRSVGSDLRGNTPVYVVGFEAKPAHDAIQAAALYRGRIAWFDHRAWPPEDVHAMRQAIGTLMLHLTPGTESVLPAVLALCGRRSRFTDKLVDLLNGSFSQHDWERWGRLWWHRLGDLGRRPGDHRSDLEPLLAGRPSDLAREASRITPPPLPAEVEFATAQDFRLVHFGGYGLIVADVPRDLDAALAARILRERFGAVLSLARNVGSETFVIGAEETGGRVLDVSAMVDHLAEKLEWVEALPGGDHVARFRIRDLDRHPGRLDEAVAEIGMSRSILDG
ncbi:MAG TPA: hypothetical protein VNE71_06365, partial [Myxococcota bacterium]|nr:hypothetical protein [Myxococcota bacterium]